MKWSELEPLIQKLPEHPEILGKEDFFQAVILLLLIEIGEELHFVFQKRSLHIRQGGEICFPGGGFHPGRDKNLRDTVLRETEEEMGIAPERIEILGRTNTLVTLQGTTVDGFIGITDLKSLEEMRPNPLEVESIFSLPVEYFLETPPKSYRVWMEIKSTILDGEGKEQVLLPVEELGLPDYYRGSWGGKNYEIFVYPTEYGPVWGITARFIRDFIRNIS